MAITPNDIHNKDFFSTKFKELRSEVNDFLEGSEERIRNVNS